MMFLLTWLYRHKHSLKMWGDCAQAFHSVVFTGLFLHKWQKRSPIQMSVCSLALEPRVHSYCSLCSFHSSVRAKCMQLNKHCGLSSIIQDDTTTVFIATVSFMETATAWGSDTITVFLPFYLNRTFRMTASPLELIGFCLDSPHAFANMASFILCPCNLWMIK